jgi:hypothetical protein
MPPRAPRPVAHSPLNLNHDDLIRKIKESLTGYETIVEERRTQGKSVDEIEPLLASLRQQLTGLKTEKAKVDVLIEKKAKTNIKKSFQWYARE